jgi:hypothetical protein
MEWAQVRALDADGISQREIAARLGINRRTVARLAAADGPPRDLARGLQLDGLGGCGQAAARSVASDAGAGGAADGLSAGAGVAGRLGRDADPSADRRA